MRSQRVSKGRTILFLSALLVFVLLSLGVGEPGWADVETVKTFGLVESGTLIETAIFNDGSVVYVRVNVGAQSGGSFSNVRITDDMHD